MTEHTFLLTINLHVQQAGGWAGRQARFEKITDCTDNGNSINDVFRSLCSSKLYCEPCNGGSKK